MRGKLTLVFFLWSVWLTAQESGGSFTLEQCVSYALENNVEVKNALLDEQIAAAQVKETVGIGLPQVSGAVAVQKSPTQQRFFSQYVAPQGGEGGGFSVLSPEDAAQLGIDDGEVFAAQNFFQLQGAGDASLSINQLIFNGSYIVGLQASKTFKELSVKQSIQTNEAVVLNVSKAFYNVLITKERLELVNANILRLDTLFRNTYAMYENGFAEKIDADRIKVTMNNMKADQSNLENLYDVSVRLLKFQMNYPYDQEIQVNGSLEDQAIQPLDLPDPESWEYSMRPDYQILETNRRLQELNIRNKYAEAVPVISAFANLGYSTQSPDFGGIFSTNTEMNETDQIGPDGWYGYSTLGLRLNWNIFTGLQRTFQIQQEKLSLSKVENSFELLEKSIDLEIQQAEDNLANALNKLEVQQENRQLATEIFDITQTKYEEGVGSNLEVIEADTSLKEAQTNYYNALYDALVAQLELKKALGILYQN